MTEQEQMLDAWAEAQRTGTAAVLATVVKVQGSAYRRPGARLLLLADGQKAGSISGGCLEGDLARKAWWLTSAGGPVIRRYDTTSDEDAMAAFGLGCNGVVDVLLERLEPGSPHSTLSLLADCLRLGRGGVVATVIGTEGDPGMRVGNRLLLSASGMPLDTLPNASLMACVGNDLWQALAYRTSAHLRREWGSGSVEVFLEVIQPPQSLVVFGAGHDAVPLVALAKQLGWHVTVADGRSHQARRERFPTANEVLVADGRAPLRGVKFDARTAVVLMTHSMEQDRAILEALLPLSLPYLGVLGPRKRTMRLLEEISPHRDSRGGALPAGLHSPAGLDVGAETPEEIALSIVAEVQAVVAGGSGGHLRDRCGPIHSAPARASSRENALLVHTGSA